MSTLRLQAATLANVSVISDLAESIWRRHYPAIIGLQQVEYMLEKLYSKQTLEEQVGEATQLYFLLVEVGASNPIGFLSVEIRSENSGFISKFYVLQIAQRTGHGSAAFNALVDKFPSITEFRLQVNRQNIQAINFYFKQGFTIEKTADFDIGSGYFMNDFIMLWRR